MRDKKLKGGHSLGVHNLRVLDPLPTAAPLSKTVPLFSFITGEQPPITQTSGGQSVFEM